MAEFAALGVASSILQIVDFGMKVFHTTYELAKASADASTQNVELESLAEEHRNVAKRLQLSLQSRASLSFNEKALVQISTDCIKLTEELLNLLGRLKVPQGSRNFRRVLESTKAAVKTHRKRDEIESYRRQLQQRNTQLATALLLVLRYVKIGAYDSYKFYYKGH